MSGLDEELHSRKSRVAVEQVDSLERHAQRAVLHRQMVKEGADVELELVALRFGVVKLRPHDKAVRRHVEFFDSRCLQQVVATARRLLRKRTRALETLDTQ